MTVFAVYQRLAPCIDDAGHNFIAHFPPAGTFGQVQVICTRCGTSKAEAAER